MKMLPSNVAEPNGFPTVLLKLCYAALASPHANIWRQTFIERTVPSIPNWHTASQPAKVVHFPKTTVTLPLIPLNEGL